MAKRRRRRKRNPESLSPKLISHLQDLVEKAWNVQDKAYTLSTHTDGPLSKLLDKLGETIGDIVEEIEDEAGIAD